jgi:hypothetical protein
MLVPANLPVAVSMGWGIRFAKGGRDSSDSLHDRHGRRIRSLGRMIVELVSEALVDGFHRSREATTCR